MEEMRVERSLCPDQFDPKLGGLYMYFVPIYFTSGLEGAKASLTGFGRLTGT